MNYEFERDSGYTSEDAFTSYSADEDEQEVEDSVEELVLMLNEPEMKTESSDEDQLLDEKLSSEYKGCRIGQEDRQGLS